MKKNLLLLLVISISFVGLVNAQESKNIKIMVGFGVSPPTAILNEGWKLGYNGSFKIGFPVGEQVDILFGAEYNTFPLDDPNDVVFSGGAVSTTNFGIDIKFNITLSENSINPYFIVGSGLTVFSVEDFLFLDGFKVNGGRETKLYMQGGFGLEFSLGSSTPTKGFVQLKYVNLFTTDVSLRYFPISLGISF